MKHLIYINPNATQAMTQGVVDVARTVVPEATIWGLTNMNGPAAIEGPEDGKAAIPGMLTLVERANSFEADAIVIACFDDTGLDQAAALANCPVFGIGQSAYTIGAQTDGGFAVVTSVEASVPVIVDNIQDQGFSEVCHGVVASGIPVLDIDAGTDDMRDTLADAINATAKTHSAGAIVLGCAGMSPLFEDLAKRTGVALIDGVRASAELAIAATGS